MQYRPRSQADPRPPHVFEWGEVIAKNGPPIVASSALASGCMMPADTAGPHSSTAPTEVDGHATEGAPRLTRIGPYRILRVLGEGGMGVVYLAEQDEPVHRQVALKVLRGGPDTKGIVARFRSEQQTLAIMEHPNITRVYDAGETDSGLLYFVMERVAGDPITDYADAHRLTVRERIQLFTQVCRAVQHAHQKGMIHRDIKPSNVLVTETDGEPMCKVIDFGIAKAIAPTADTARLTMTGMALGTPAYMSPEQFLSDGTDVDTRADIYALGAMLYELLAGVLPYDPGKYSGWAALLAQHITHEAAAPSVQYAGLPMSRRMVIGAERRTDPEMLRSTLAGDLDCVILTALEHERERRYATANALALDLENYLDNKPVAVHTSSFPYRARKFTRRHRVGVAFASTVFVLLAASAIGATIQARRLSRARAVAVARQAQAEQLVGFMLGDLRDTLTSIGRLDVLDGVGKRALAYFAAVPASQLSNEELYRRAEALQQLGNVRLSQGKLPDAADLMRRSLAISTRLAAHDSLNGRWQIGLAHSHFWAGNVEWELGNVDSALGHFLPFVTISRRLIRHYPDSLAYRAELAYALNNIGFAKEAKGDVAGALASYRAALAMDQDLVNRDSTKADWKRSLGDEYNAEAVVQRKLGDLSGALASHRHELAIREAVLARDPTNSDLQVDVAISHVYRSELRLSMGDVDGALADANASRAIYASLAARDTSNVTRRWALGRSYRQIAQALLERGDATEATREINVGQAITTRLLAEDPDNSRALSEAVLAGTTQARALLELGRIPGALAAAQRATAIGDAAVKQKPADIGRHRAASDAYLALGEVLSHSGDPRGATGAYSHALSLIDSAATAYRQTESLAAQAAALLELGRFNDAALIAAELARRGYRRPTFVKLVHDRERRAA